MAGRNTLSDYEVSIIKKLLAKENLTNQEIAGLINRSRGDASKDVSSGRITNIKQGDIQKYVPVPIASDADVEKFYARLEAFDNQTGLNLYDDERLIRSREAMLLAVQIFNSPGLRFKTEVFSVLANIAWTYLLHDFHSRNGREISEENGRTVELSQMLRWPDCPVSEGARKNLEALKEIRDEVEHKTFGRTDGKWLTLFQACCLNYEKTICELFGERLTLKDDLAFALQFAKLSVDQISAVQEYDVPQNIAALDARLEAELTDNRAADLEYRFKVIYTLDSASKSEAQLKFVSPSSDEAKDIRNILVKHKPADELYPYKPGRVCELVSERTGKNFTSHNHTQAWRAKRVRPRKGAARPDQTDQQYCIYHAAHGDYTYSEKWVALLETIVSDEESFQELKGSRL